MNENLKTVIIELEKCSNTLNERKLGKSLNKVTKNLWSYIKENNIDIDVDLILKLKEVNND